VSEKHRFQALWQLLHYFDALIAQKRQ